MSLNYVTKNLTEKQTLNFKILISMIISSNGKTDYVTIKKNLDLSKLSINDHLLPGLIAHDDIALFNKVREQYNISLDYFNKESGFSLLYHSCNLNAPKITRFLLEQGADPNQQKLLFNRENLFVAYPKIIITLDKFKNKKTSAINIIKRVIVDSYNNTKKIDFSKIEKIVQLNKLSVYNELLPLFIDNDDISLFRDAIDYYKFSLTYSDIYGITFLQYSCKLNAPKLTQFLLEQGLDPNKQDSMGMHSILVTGSMEIIKLLLENNANPNLQNKDGRTALHYYIQQESLNEDLILLLLQFNADPTIKDNNNRTVQTYALSRIMKGSMSVNFCSIIAAFRFPNLQNEKNGCTLLHDWLKNESPNETYIKLLLQFGADPTIENDLGESALYCAAMNGKISDDLYNLIAAAAEVKSLMEKLKLVKISNSETSIIETSISEKPNIEISISENSNSENQIAEKRSKTIPPWISLGKILQKNGLFSIVTSFIFAEETPQEKISQNIQSKKN